MIKGLGRQENVAEGREPGLPLQGPVGGVSSSDVWGRQLGGGPDSWGLPCEVFAF